MKPGSVVCRSHVGGIDDGGAGRRGCGYCDDVSERRGRRGAGQAPAAVQITWPVAADGGVVPQVHPVGGVIEENVVLGGVC